MKCRYDIRKIFKYLVSILIILLLFINFYLIYKLNIKINKIINDQTSIKNEIALMTESISIMNLFLKIQQQDQETADIQKQIDLLKQVDGKIKDLFDKKKALELKKKIFEDDNQCKD